jgi:mRNA-degrading endonuclease RelE of RelBE toxin-antitoxin system
MMDTEFTPQAARDYRRLSPVLKERMKKQLDLLRRDIRHPSIRAKKYSEGLDVWQGRVNQDYRFFFQIVGDTYRILSIVPHPK